MPNCRKRTLECFNFKQKVHLKRFLLFKTCFFQSRIIVYLTRRFFSQFYQELLLTKYPLDFLNTYQFPTTI